MLTSSKLVLKISDNSTRIFDTIPDLEDLKWYQDYNPDKINYFSIVSELTQLGF